jgi:hypothetical protein
MELSLYELCLIWLAKASTFSLSQEITKKLIIKDIQKNETKMIKKLKKSKFIL